MKTRGRPKKRDHRKEDDRASLLREISKHKEKTKYISPIENDNSNESLPDLNQPIQTKSLKRKIDENSPVLPKAKKRTCIRKCSRSNSMEEGIKSLCKNRVMRRHTQNEQDSSRNACSENRGRNCLGENDSVRDVSGNDRTQQVKYRKNIVPNKHEARLNTSSTAKTRRVDGETKRNLSAENSICKDTVSESILECIRREKTSEQVKSKSNKPNDLGLKTSSFISREKEKIGTEHHNRTETKCKRKGRKVSIENALARKSPSSSKIEDPQPNIPPCSQPKIKKEPEDDVRPTPGPRWPPHCKCMSLFTGLKTMLFTCRGTKVVNISCSAWILLKEFLIINKIHSSSSFDLLCVLTIYCLLSVYLVCL